MSRNSYSSTGPSNISNAPDEPFFVEIDESPPSAASRSAVEETGKPTWFQGSSDRKTPPGKAASSSSKRPSARPQKPGRKRGPIVKTEDNEPEEELTWQEQLKQWMYGEGGAGYGVSVLVHIVLLLIMSFIIYSRPAEEDVVLTAVQEEEMVEIDSLVDVEIVDMKIEELQIDKPEFEPAPLSLTNLGIGSLALTSDKAGGILNVPIGAVTKGSFTVWTVPKDPVPGQQYIIMIRVTNLGKQKRYERRDLSGNVVGTDGYKDYFGGPTESGTIEVKDDSVQVEACKVPGAAMLVKDIITVESKILKEKQVIELVF